ncbi:methyltransferase [Paractinoplanes abujensis]|uniref:Ubiquinone/menaquinone biosynthesis C-methylase UbiE n=1 Tax=Paractinoplanes abujensis TaxID=882441 RepID=A0A7W7CU43_9ACTN|nr:class I SAM-dependent methyltransferase [Actinoplanes abujensis]MBB4693410.1 ubiquinone/menaquinone biosynthesis C-methylase UbiE [Actinoplanes abujensis]GID24614.1 methyltransferase [Actinoplanes abujensis]
MGGDAHRRRQLARQISPSSLGQPDYNEAARGWDRLEFLIRPVAEAIVERLPDPAPGAFVLDLGCGTGEPGLTVRTRHPAVRLLGVDRADLMVEIARAKARSLGFDNTTFETRLMSDTAVASASVDLLVSRFAFLMLDHQTLDLSLAEATRVLRPGAAYSFAVWDRSELNTLITLFRSVLSGFPGGESLPDPSAINYLADPGHRADLLLRAGVTTVEEAPLSWDTRIPDRDSLVDVLEHTPFGAFFTSLEPAGRAEAVSRIIERAGTYREPDGGYRFPTTCRLFWGRR